MAYYQYSDSWEKDVCLLLIGQAVSEKILKRFSRQGSMLNYVHLWRPSWIDGGIIGKNSEKGQPEDHFIKVPISHALLKEQIFSFLSIGAMLKLYLQMAAMFNRPKANKYFFLKILQLTTILTKFCFNWPWSFRQELPVFHIRFR